MAGDVRSITFCLGIAEKTAGQQCATDLFHFFPAASSSRFAFSFDSFPSLVCALFGYERRSINLAS